MTFNENIQQYASKKSAEFSGRLSLSDFLRSYSFFLIGLCFIFSILYSLLMIKMSLLGDTTFDKLQILGQFLPTYLYASLVFAMTKMVLQVRRLHDSDKSGWLLFLWFVPIVGVSFLIYFLFFAKGTDSDNRFGAIPVKKTYQLKDSNSTPTSFVDKIKNFVTGEADSDSDEVNSSEVTQYVTGVDDETNTLNMYSYDKS